MRPTARRRLNNRLLAATLAFFGWVTASQSQANEKPIANSINTLTQNELQEAFRTLSQHYIDKQSLNYEELNKAALDGLLHRLSFGASIVEREPKQDHQAEDDQGLQFYQEILTPEIAYLRPVHFTPDEIDSARDALKSFSAHEVKTLVIDFRAPVTNAEFARVAAFIDLFSPAGQILFKIAKPNDDKPQLFLSKSAPQWQGDLILLVDADTSPAAETAAAAINHVRPSLIVGEKTRGAAVQFEEVALTPDTALRFASAHVLLPDDSTLFRSGVSPRIKTRTRPAAKRNIFQQSEEKGLSQFILDRERPRMNEAALVSGINPELEFHLAKSAGESTQWDKRPLQDTALQSVIEFLKTASFLNLTGEEKD